MILLAEDNPADVFLVRQAMAEASLSRELLVVDDGELAVDFIDGLDADEVAACPELLLLDLNLPKKSGEEVLAHLRQSRRCAHIPVIILTSSSSQRDQENTARLGANFFFTKPNDLDAFLRLGPILQDVLDDRCPARAS